MASGQIHWPLNQLGGPALLSMKLIIWLPDLCINRMTSHGLRDHYLLSIWWLFINSWNSINKFIFRDSFNYFRHKAMICSTDFCTSTIGQLPSSMILFAIHKFNLILIEIFPSVYEKWCLNVCIDLLYIIFVPITNLCNLKQVKSQIKISIKTELGRNLLYVPRNFRTLRCISCQLHLHFTR